MFSQMKTRAIAFGAAAGAAAAGEEAAFQPQQQHQERSQTGSHLRLTTQHGATEDGTGRGTPRAASPGGASVRRLMPVETERLMGWPDGHTALGIDEDGTEYALSDTARYRL